VLAGFLAYGIDYGVAGTGVALSTVATGERVLEGGDLEAGDYLEVT